MIFSASMTPASVAAALAALDGTLSGQGIALRDRRTISADGIFIVVATVSSDDRAPVADPEVIFRGVPFIEESDGFVDDLRDVIEDSLEKLARAGTRELHLIQEDLHDDVAEFVYERLRRRPMILPVVVEV